MLAEWLPLFWSYIIIFVKVTFCQENIIRLTFRVLFTWTQDVNQTYIVCLKDVLDIFWTSYILSIYVLCPGRSSYQRCSLRNCVLRNFTKFMGKHLCASLFFNKVAVLRPATLSKKRLKRRCFPVSFAKFLKTPFLQNTFWRLPLSRENK